MKNSTRAAVNDPACRDYLAAKVKRDGLHAEANAERWEVQVSERRQRQRVVFRAAGTRRKHQEVEGGGICGELVSHHRHFGPERQEKLCQGACEAVQVVHNQYSHPRGLSKYGMTCADSRPA